MKICPRCQKTYSDDNLNFCLEDGSVLNQYGGGEPMQPTIAVNQARPTQGAAPAPDQAAWNVGGQQPYSMQPQKKSSKAWIWVLLILGGIILLCGGGFVGLIFLAARQADDPPPPRVAVNRSSANRASNSSNSTSTTASTSDRNDVETVDISTWVKENSVYGVTELKNGEFIMSSKNKGYYYVLVAPDRYTTDDADTRVTLRNVDDAASSLGYGLIFHSNPQPLQQDYALLIDTKRKRYRVVRHEPQKETAIVNWTSSPAIKPGTAENVLEARDLPDKIELYINGTMVTSIKNIYGFAGGVPGLYSGDAAKIAFKDLEIRK
jgi:hypothetical protein